jgi:hypothetical protein
MNAQLDEEFRDFMHSRWPAMVRLAYALTELQVISGNHGWRRRPWWPR